MIKELIRKKLPNIWKKYKIITSKERIHNFKKEDNKIFIFLAADYPNIGDIAITYAQNLFLKKCFPDYKIIEIPADKTLSLIKFIKKNIKANDIITIIGGGNMGNIYEYYEELRRTVIKYFSKNYIISFPQTIDFTNDKEGKKSLAKTIRTVKKSKKILILAREEKSYNKMKEYFGREKVKISPDIVLSLKDSLNIRKEEIGKIGICFRNDKEEDINKLKIKEEILLQINAKKAIVFDTVLKKDEFAYENRYEEFYKILNNIASCDVLYTNRLHAMIFAYLVDTNCYFIDNTNKKLSETYKKWLSNVSYIKEYDVKKGNSTRDINLEKEFEKLRKEIIKGVKKWIK